MTKIGQGWIVNFVLLIIILLVILGVLGVGGIREALGEALKEIGKLIGGG